MEKIPHYTPSPEELNKANEMAYAAESEQQKRIWDLCKKIEAPLEEIQKILGRKVFHADDPLIRQSREYGLKGCREIRSGLNWIEKAK